MYIFWFTYGAKLPYDGWWPDLMGVIHTHYITSRLYSESINVTFMDKFETEVNTAKKQVCMLKAFNLYN